ncbi:MAG TPA: T9SS type A sorting domain-containing protein [Vicingus sp.]|nr:T9SS type A sorting domain-containing protein [Flavobacteriales bacterium]HRN41708.1 T9SS type A sorting domain-containing protein [Vicingus sp.]
MKKFIFISFLTMNFLPVYCQTANIRGMYVDGFNTILGNSQKEDSLLNYAQQNNFNYLALYNLWNVHTSHNLTNLTSSVILANFIQNAKQNYGIAQVGAVGENFFFFNNVINVYNQQHTNILQKFDVYNVEFEFWNTTTVSSGNYYCTTYLQPAGYSCDTAGAFSYYTKLIRQVDSLANLNGVVSELYVGWFNQGQAITMGNNIDRILLHDYINNYSWLYSYVSTRLQYLSARNVVTEVIPIFSAEPSFMGSWITTHPIVQPYNDLVSAFDAATGSWKQYINLNGYQWFAYSFMPLNPISTAVSTVTEENFSFYPVPANDYLTIVFDENVDATIEILNTMGQVCFLDKIQNNRKIQLNTTSLSNGIYFCNIVTKHKTTLKKILINR